MTSEPVADAVPDDIADALRRQPAADTAFQRLAPSHRREYLEWIRSAKKAETRQRRIAETIEMLTTGQR